MEGIEDLPDVQQDMEIFTQNIQRYGFKDIDIVKRKNLDYATTNKMFLGFERKININARRGLQTLTMVYYSGHSMMKDNMNWIVVPDPQKPLYNVEAKLRYLGSLDKSYVIGVFDCCREAYNEDILPPGIDNEKTDFD